MTLCTCEYWKDDEVGTTYEIHFVYFSAIGIGINEEETSMLIGRFGLAATGRGMLNPIVAMQRQVYFFVGDESSMVDDMNHGWQKK